MGISDQKKADKNGTAKPAKPPKPEDFAANTRRIVEYSAKGANAECFDCQAQSPRWCSFNLGIFVCLRCSGLHRSLGVHISKVRSTNMDNWTVEQIEWMEKMGNDRGVALFMAKAPEDFKKPPENIDDTTQMALLRTKYDRKAWWSEEALIMFDPVKQREIKLAEKARAKEEKREKAREDRRAARQAEKDERKAERKAKKAAKKKKRTEKKSESEDESTSDEEAEKSKNTAAVPASPLGASSPQKPAEANGVEKVGAKTEVTKAETPKSPAEPQPQISSMLASAPSPTPATSATPAATPPRGRRGRGVAVDFSAFEGGGVPTSP